MILFIKHIEIEGPGIFEEFFNTRTTYKTATVELEKQEALPQPEACEAIIILGGPMNVYDTEDYPFLIIEEDFLRVALAREIPLLGICLGAQLLAKIYGAEVKRAEKGEIGWYKVSLTEEGEKDPLFYNLGRNLNVFQWHQDTFDLPLGGRLLAEGEICKHQAVRFTEYSWGIQFHLEITLKMLESWFDYYSPNLDKYKLLSEGFKNWSFYYRQAELFLLNFNRFIAQRR
ncbi:MAG: type 1 glutamine amidotransferase [Candidatus Omnitrophica bacterium]|nr:type 1 glutamine amidotransferase [Candidatus Omnitrophota bacterium]MCM8794133.1 type 1 glutamine amidotransferase [Candidatus Omnitrophota bacterium]